MKKLNQLVSTAVPLNIEDIDTDQIIPARFLKAISKEGFGENLFRDWRYDKSGNEIPDFVLNDSTYAGQILVAGNNFGCGSSREHAAWALADYGFRVVISGFFADIFKENALNNGILPITVSDNELSEIFQKIKTNPESTFSVNLSSQLLTDKLGLYIHFDIDPYKKECLLNGYDDIDFLLSIKDEIKSYEEKRTISNS